MQNRLKTAFIAILFAAYLSAGQKRREEKTWEEEMLQINMHYYRYDDNYSGWYLCLRTGRGNSFAYEFDQNDDFGGIVSCSIKIVKRITNTGFMIRHAEQGTSWDMREICSERFIDITQARNGFLDLYVIQDESEIGYWRPEMLQTNSTNKVIVSPSIHMTAMNTPASEEPVNQLEIQSTTFIQSNKLAKTFTNDIQIIDETESNDNEIRNTNIDDIKLDGENICDLELDNMKIVGSKINEKKRSNKNIGGIKISGKKTSYKMISDSKIPNKKISSKNVSDINIYAKKMSGIRTYDLQEKHLQADDLRAKELVNDILSNDKKTNDILTNDNKTNETNDTKTNDTKTNDTKINDTITYDTKTSVTKTIDVITNEIKTDNAKTVYAQTEETETNITIMDDASAQDESFSIPAAYEKRYRTTFHLLLIISAMVVVVTFLILQVCNIM